MAEVPQACTPQFSAPGECKLAQAFSGQEKGLHTATGSGSEEAFTHIQACPSLPLGDLAETQDLNKMLCISNTP